MEKLKYNINKILNNNNKIEKLYSLLGMSILIHYILVILFSGLIIKEIFNSGEYKKIYKNKSLIIVEIVLLFSSIMALTIGNYYGLVGIPILFCLIVGRYYTFIINNNTKNNIIDLISKMSFIPFFTTLIEIGITKNRGGYFFFHNPNYLGTVMMLVTIINLYLIFNKKDKIYYLLLILNILTIFMAGSRSALIAVIIGIFTILFFHIKKHYFIGGISILFCYVLGVLNGIFPFLRLDTVVQYFWLRVDIVKMAIVIFKRTEPIYLLFGHGNFYYYKFTNFVYPHTHNALVESLLSYGVVGTLLLTIVFLKYLFEILENNIKNNLKIALIIGILVNNITDFTIFWIQTVLLFIMIMTYKDKG